MFTQDRFLINEMHHFTLHLQLFMYTFNQCRELLERLIFLQPFFYRGKLSNRIISLLSRLESMTH